MPDYSQGKIYQILNTVTDDVYIGSTIQPLYKRMHGHRSNASISHSLFCQKMNEYGYDQVFIELVDVFIHRFAIILRMGCL